MKYTSAQAAKLLRKLNEEKNALLIGERKTSVFTAATTEDKETVRLEYDYTATQADITSIDKKIRIVKHALNLFNTQTVIPGFDITIDEALVYMPQLKERESKLSNMKQRLQKGERIGATTYGRQSALIEYSYPNYTVEDAKRDYEAVVDELAKLQNALDLVNSTVELEINI